MASVRSGQVLPRSYTQYIQLGTDCGRTKRGPSGPPYRVILILKGSDLGICEHVTIQSPFHIVLYSLRDILILDIHDTSRSYVGPSTYKRTSQTKY